LVDYGSSGRYARMHHKKTASLANLAIRPAMLLRKLADD
jgi:hypothetical protein